MHIKKFDSNYSRRFFMKQVATGALATGVWHRLVDHCHGTDPGRGLSG